MRPMHKLQHAYSGRGTFRGCLVGLKAIQIALLLESFQLDAWRESRRRDRGPV